MSKEVEQLEKELIAQDGTINVERLEALFSGILEDAVKSNKGNLAAARRFRIATTDFGHAAIKVRAITPKMK